MIFSGCIERYSPVFALLRTLLRTGVFLDKKNSLRYTNLEYKKDSIVK